MIHVREMNIESWCEGTKHTERQKKTEQSSRQKKKIPRKH